ncbi:MAG: SMI1/KNR4 family protein [Betaproteobacteria bacterium]|nr:SMI1/KNR4 family protein [Betaproteobacteria bacterium]
MQMTSIDRILARWREERVPLNPAATIMQLESLERFLGMPLPADLRGFYAAANGMEDYRHDSRMICMWSIERIVRERDIHEGEDEWGPFRDIAFSDVIFYAWHFRFRVRSEGRVSVIAELTHEEFPSLFALFDALISRPDSLGLVGSAKSGH